MVFPDSACNKHPSQIRTVSSGNQQEILKVTDGRAAGYISRTLACTCYV